MKNSERKSRERKAIKEEQQHKKKVILKFRCEICCQRRLLKRIFQIGGLCVHFFCVDCIAKYVEVKVEGLVGNIICPALNCNHPLDPMSCKPTVAKEIFDKWCDLQCESAVLGSYSCYCPCNNCSELVLNECRGKLKKMNCPNCKNSFCFQCKTPWHTGYRCGEREQRNDYLAIKLIKKNKWKRCYNCGRVVERIGGGRVVERIGGCRHIECKCGMPFCYQCGGRYHDGSCYKLLRVFTQLFGRLRDFTCQFFGRLRDFTCQFFGRLWDFTSQFFGLLWDFTSKLFGCLGDYASQFLGLGVLVVAAYGILFSR